MRGVFFASVFAGAGMFAGTSAVAGPILYVDVTNGSQTSGVLSSNTGSIDLNGLVVGNYTFGVGAVNTSPNNLSAIDFTNFSTTGAANPGMLQIEVSATGLLSSIPSLINFLTLATGNVLSGALSSMTIYTYADNTNAVFGTQSLLDTLKVGAIGNGAFFGTSQTALWNALASPFSETLIIDLTLASNSDLSADTSVVPTPAPEPGSLLLMGSGLLALVALRRWRGA
jgi:hypothetical protein